MSIKANWYNKIHIIFATRYVGKNALTQITVNKNKKITINQHNK